MKQQGVWFSRYQVVVKSRFELFNILAFLPIFLTRIPSYSKLPKLFTTFITFKSKKPGSNLSYYHLSYKYGAQNIMTVRHCSNTVRNICFWDQKPETKIDKTKNSIMTIDTPKIVYIFQCFQLKYSNHLEINYDIIKYTYNCILK